MITETIDGCTVDILPFVKGLKSEQDKVTQALESGEYDAVAIALGIEDIEAIRRRAEIEGEYESSDLDMVYSHFLKDFGDIDMPDPASVMLIDQCSAKGMSVIPLDMNDEEYTKLYCDTVTTLEFLKEKRLIKKAMKTDFDKSSPEAFVLQWDSLVNGIKGYAQMSRYRESYIAEQIKDTAKYRKHLLALIEHERVQGVLDILEG